MAWLPGGQGLSTAPPSLLRGPWKVSVGRTFLPHPHRPLPSDATAGTEPGIEGQPEALLEADVPVPGHSWPLTAAGVWDLGC